MFFSLVVGHCCDRVFHVARFFSYLYPSRIACAEEILNDNPPRFVVFDAVELTNRARNLFWSKLPVTYLEVGVAVGVVVVRRWAVL